MHRNRELQESFEEDFDNGLYCDGGLVAMFKTMICVQWKDAKVTSPTLYKDADATIALTKSFPQTFEDRSRIDTFLISICDIKGVMLRLAIHKRTRKGRESTCTLLQHVDVPLDKVETYDMSKTNTRIDLVLRQMQSFGLIRPIEVSTRISSINRPQAFVYGMNRDRKTLPEYILEYGMSNNPIVIDNTPTPIGMLLSVSWGVWCDPTTSMPFPLERPIYVDVPVHFSKVYDNMDAKELRIRSKNLREILRWHIDLEDDDKKLGGGMKTPQGLEPKEFDDGVQLFEHQSRYVQWAQSVEQNYANRASDPSDNVVDYNRYFSSSTESYIPGMVLIDGNYRAMHVYNNSSNTKTGTHIFHADMEDAMRRMMHVRSLRRILPPLRGGILADECGLGKTPSAIGLIADSRATTPRFIRGPDPHLEWRIPVDTTLVVLASTLICHWKEQIQKIAPRLRVSCIQTTKEFERLTFDDVMRSDILLVSDRFIQSAWCKRSTFHIPDVASEPVSKAPKRFFVLSHPMIPTANSLNQNIYRSSTTEEKITTATRPYTSDHSCVLGTGVGKDSATSTVDGVVAQPLGTTLFRYWMARDPRLVDPAFQHDSTLDFYREKNMFPNPLLFHFKRVIVDEVQSYFSTLVHTSGIPRPHASEYQQLDGVFGTSMKWLQTVSYEYIWFMSGSEPWYMNERCLDNLLSWWLPRNGKYASLPTDHEYYGTLVEQHIWRHRKSDLQKVDVIMHESSSEEVTTDPTLTMEHVYGESKKRKRPITEENMLDSMSSPPTKRRRRPLPPIEFLKISIPFTAPEQYIYDTLQANSTVWGASSDKRNAMVCSYIHAAMSILNSNDTSSNNRLLEDIYKSVRREKEGARSATSSVDDIKKISDLMIEQLRTEFDRASDQVAHITGEKDRMSHSKAVYIIDNTDKDGKEPASDTDDFVRLLDENLAQLDERLDRERSTRDSTRQSLDAYEIMIGSSTSSSVELASRSSNSAVASRTREALDDGCVICGDSYDHDVENLRPTIIPECFHVFCAGCISKWASDHSTCPQCRRTFSPSELLTVSKESRLSENTSVQLSDMVSKFGSKMTRVVLELTRLLEASPSNKIILFSSWDNMLRMIWVMLKKEANISSSICVGDRKKKDHAVAEFKNGLSRVILMPIETMSAGVDLGSANYILFVDKSTLPHAVIDREQAEGRMHRMGQEHDVVHIIDFVMRDTIEEDLYKNVLEFHRQRAVDNNNNNRSKPSGRQLPVWMGHSRGMNLHGIASKRAVPKYSRKASRASVEDEDPIEMFDSDEEEELDLDIFSNA